MQRVVRLRLRTSSILRDETVHQIEHHLLCDQWIAVNFRDALRAEAGALREAAPVVDVWDGHVVKTTGDAVGFTAAHHRNVDNFCDLGGKDARKMTQAARVLGVGKERHFSLVAFIIEVAPNQFP